MFDVIPNQGSGGISTPGSSLAKNPTPIVTKGQPLIIEKVENGFMASLNYMSVKRVYLDIDTLLADLKEHFTIDPV